MLDYVFKVDGTECGLTLRGSEMFFWKLQTEDQQQCDRIEYASIKFQKATSGLSCMCIIYVHDAFSHLQKYKQ